jgi:hypothetical protein
MSQALLDEHLSRTEVLMPLRRWTTAQKIEDLVSDETLKDDRIFQILRNQKQPTFVTLDAGFFYRRYRDRRYCIIYFVLLRQEQSRLPRLLRQLFRLQEFNTKAARMGKIARVSGEKVEFWQVGDEKKRIAKLPAMR